MNLTASNLHATIKLHKQSTPIRPITSCKNAPAYELAKQLSKTLNSYIYHIHTMFGTDLQAVELNKDMRLCSFDIKQGRQHHTLLEGTTHTQGAQLQIGLCSLVVKSSWLQLQRFRVRFPPLPDFLRSGGSGTRSTQPRKDN
jgi:hypothetical protein